MSELNGFNKLQYDNSNSAVSDANITCYNCIDCKDFYRRDQQCRFGFTAGFSTNVTSLFTEVTGLSTDISSHKNGTLQYSCYAVEGFNPSLGRNSFVRGCMLHYGNASVQCRSSFPRSKKCSICNYNLCNGATTVGVTVLTVLTGILVSFKV